MTERPAIAVGDWITIGKTNCVVSVRRPDLAAFSGDIEVVFNAAKPANHDAEWDGDKWVFSKRGDFGGYAEGRTRLDWHPLCAN